MRDLISKIVTGSMIAGAALLVTACGGKDDEANNTAMYEMNATDTMFDGATNDVTAIDAGTGADANMAADTMTMDANSTTTGPAAPVNTTEPTTATDTELNGM